MGRKKAKQTTCSFNTNTSPSSVFRKQEKPVRLSLCPNKGFGKGKVCTVVLVPPLWGDIARAAANRLKFNKKQIKQMRLFIYQATEKAKAGFELPKEGCLANYLVNDTVICVSAGEEFGDTSGARLKGSDTEISKPPRWPWPGKGEVSKLQPYNKKPS